MKSDLDALIIGAGFAGLGMAIRLLQAGVTRLAILEQASEIGGAWRDNTYPGCACDIPSHLYSWSFEPNPEWTRMYPTQPEIQAYLLRAVEHRGLRPKGASPRPPGKPSPPASCWRAWAGSAVPLTPTSPARPPSPDPPSIRPAGTTPSTWPESASPSSAQAPAARMARAHLAADIADPELRRKLTPTYRMGCKRILLSNDYYPALARPNAELITAPIDRITPSGVVTADGGERPADALIYGAGFRATDLLSPLRIIGRGGLEAYHGVTVTGYPNLFILVGPNTGLGHNSIVFIIEAQIHYVLECLRLMELRGVRAIDVKPAAQRRCNLDIQQRLRRTVWASGCKSWCLDARGANTTLWLGSTISYWAQTREPAAADYSLLR